jgi:hypothetical protein
MAAQETEREVPEAARVEVGATSSPEAAQEGPQEEVALGAAPVEVDRSQPTMATPDKEVETPEVE